VIRSPIDHYRSRRKNSRRSFDQQSWAARLQDAESSRDEGPSFGSVDMFPSPSAYPHARACGARVLTVFPSPPRQGIELTWLGGGNSRRGGSWHGARSRPRRPDRRAARGRREAASGGSGVNGQLHTLEPRGSIRSDLFGSLRLVSPVPLEDDIDGALSLGFDLPVPEPSFQARVDRPWAALLDHDRLRPSLPQGASEPRKETAGAGGVGPVDVAKTLGGSQQSFLGIRPPPPSDH
jgi:hypothetical protein